MSEKQQQKQHDLTLPKLSDLKIGDKVDRSLGGVIMSMTVRKIEDGLIYCEPSETYGWPDSELYTFETGNGVEYDPDLEWGSKWGATGSYLIVERKTSH